MASQPRRLPGSPARARIGPLLNTMIVAGGYMLTTHVTVTSGFWTVWGYNAFGISLIPFIFGVAILFFNGRSVLGWLLLLGGVVIILTGILMNLQIYFQHANLFELIVMLVLLFGGLGLLARSFRAHG